MLEGYFFSRINELNAVLQPSRGSTSHPIQSIWTSTGPVNPDVRERKVIPR